MPTGASSVVEEVQVAGEVTEVSALETAAMDSP
jgi:hypothetical protein